MVLFEPNDAQDNDDNHQGQMVLYGSTRNEHENRMIVYNKTTTTKNDNSPMNHYDGAIVPALPRTVATRSAGPPAHHFQHVVDQSFSMDSQGGVTMEPDEILTTASSLTDIDMFTGGHMPLALVDQPLLDDLNRWKQQGSMLGINDFELPGDFAHAADDADDDGYESLVSGEPLYAAGVFRAGGGRNNKKENEENAMDEPQSASPKAKSQVDRLRGKASSSPVSKPHSSARTLNPLSPENPPRMRTRSPMSWRNVANSSNNDNNKEPLLNDSLNTSTSSAALSPKMKTRSPDSWRKMQEDNNDSMEESPVVVSPDVSKQESKDSAEPSEETSNTSVESEEELTGLDEKDEELKDATDKARFTSEESLGLEKDEQPKDTSNTSAPVRQLSQDGPEEKKELKVETNKIDSAEREPVDAQEPQSEAKEDVAVEAAKPVPSRPVGQSKVGSDLKIETRSISPGKSRPKPSVVVVNSDTPNDMNPRNKSRKFGKIFQSFRRKKSSRRDLGKEETPPKKENLAKEEPVPKNDPVTEEPAPTKDNPVKEEAQLTPATMDSESDTDSRASSFSFRIVGVVDDDEGDRNISPLSNGANTAATTSASDDLSNDSGSPPQYFQPMNMYNDKEVSPAVVGLPVKRKAKAKYSTPAIEQLRMKKAEASSKAKRAQSMAKSRSSSILQQPNEAKEGVSWFVCYESDSEDKSPGNAQVPFMMLPVGKPREPRPISPVAMEESRKPVVPFVSFMPHVQRLQRSGDQKSSEVKLPVGFVDASRMRNKLFSQDRVKKIIESAGETSKQQTPPEPLTRHAHVLEKKPSALLLGKKTYVPTESVTKALSALGSLEARKAALRSKMRSGFSPDPVVVSAPSQIASH
mmetsp:Transcript_22660/g.63018  ORF Transcript_22660/g.63018 Transcript_22660/m.63018 type:complete len:865 (-) Transcript_22660:105-2699(-)